MQTKNAGVGNAGPENAGLEIVGLENDMNICIPGPTFSKCRIWNTNISYTSTHA